MEQQSVGCDILTHWLADCTCEQRLDPYRKIWSKSVRRSIRRARCDLQSCWLCLIAVDLRPAILHISTSIDAAENV
jgi:hypothetical protein